jgi:cell wall-associated NlpC family hydrolase
MRMNRRRWWAAWGLGVVVAAGIGGGIGLWRMHRTPLKTAQSGKPQVEIQVGQGTPVQTVDGARAASLARQLVAQPPAQYLDASAFVQYVYQQVGVSLPRTVMEQADSGRRILSKADILPGDLVFFHEGSSPDPATFVAIAVGGGEAAARTTHGYQIIDYMSGYWADKYRFAVRVGAR